MCGELLHGQKSEEGKEEVKSDKSRKAHGKESQTRSSQEQECEKTDRQTSNRFASRHAVHSRIYLLTNAVLGAANFTPCHGGGNLIECGRLRNRQAKPRVSGDRPMDKQEDAFFAALLVIVKTAVEAGMNRTVLADRLQEMAAAARAGNLHGKAAILNVVAEATDPKRHRSLKPSFDVIQGGKSGHNLRST